MKRYSRLRLARDVVLFLCLFTVLISVWPTPYRKLILAADNLELRGCSPDGRLIVTSTREKTPDTTYTTGPVRFWDTRDGSLKLRVETEICKILLSPTNRQVAVLSGKSALFDLETGREICKLDVDRSVIYWRLSASGGPDHFSPDGKLLAVGKRGGRQLELLETATGKSVGSIPLSSPNLADFTPDGQYIIVSENIGEIERQNEAGNLVESRLVVYDAITRKKVRNLDGSIANGLLMAISPQGERVVVCTGGPKSLTAIDKSQYFLEFKAWNWKTGKLEGTQKVRPERLQQPLELMSMSISGDLLLVRTNLDPDLNAYDLSMSPIRQRILATNWFGDVLPSTDGRYIGAIGASVKNRVLRIPTPPMMMDDAKPLEIWDLKDMRSIRTIHPPASTHFANPMFSPDGHRLDVGVNPMFGTRVAAWNWRNLLPGECRFFDSQTGADLGRLVSYTRPLIRSSDGCNMCALTGNVLRVWNLPTWRPWWQVLCGAALPLLLWHGGWWHFGRKRSHAIPAGKTTQSLPE